MSSQRVPAPIRYQISKVHQKACGACSRQNVRWASRHATSLAGALRWRVFWLVLTVARVTRGRNQLEWHALGACWQCVSLRNVSYAKKKADLGDGSLAVTDRSPGGGGTRHWPNQSL